jgi:cytochrome P450
VISRLCSRLLVTLLSSTFSSPDEIRNGPKLNSCEYTYACIEEALRRTAGVPSHLPRVVLSGGMTVDGHFLPTGTVVGVPAYSLHHTPTYFPDPWSFKPERWIPSPKNPPEAVALARKAFTPFGIGIRQCSGRQLAYLQLKLTAAHILWRFDLRLSPEEKGRGGGRPGLGMGRERQDEFQMWDALGFARDGPMVEFRSASVDAWKG